MGLRRSPDVGLGDVHLVFQIRLVRRNSIGTCPYLHDGCDPFAQVSRVCLRVTSQTASTPWPVEVGFLQQFAETLLSHDVQIVMSMSGSPFGRPT